MEMGQCREKRKKKAVACTVRLTAEQDERLRRLARVRGCTVSQVVREAMETVLLSDDKKRREIFKYIGAAATIIDEDEQRRRMGHEAEDRCVWSEHRRSKDKDEGGGF